MEEAIRNLPSDVVDITTFNQILEMDDSDTERDFSRSIVQAYFKQAEETITKMEDALDKEDLEALSQLGHFFKGSSASLGLIKVQSVCEDIQNLGRLSPDEPPLDTPGLAALIARARTAYEESGRELRKIYN